MPLSFMHRQYIQSARMVIFFLLLLLATSVARAATFSVTTPGQQTLTNRFLPYAGSGTQLIGNSPAWRESAGVLGINNYLEGLETLTPGAAVNLNFSTWRTKRITLSQNTVFTAINIPSASTNVQTMLLEVIGDGAFTVSFANVTWQTPEITTPEAGVVTLYALRGDNGAVKGYTQAVTATGIGPLTVGYVPLASATNNLTDSILQQPNSTNLLETGSFILTNGVFHTYTDGTAANPAYGLGVTFGAGWGLFRDVNGEPSISSSAVPRARFSADSLRIPGGNAFIWSVGDTETTPIRLGIYSGNGSPEGVQTANPGSVYLDYTNGDIYKKSSGVLDTGWAMLSTGAGSPLWSSSSGNLTPSPAVDVVSIESQSSDASTNIALVVKSTAAWTNNSALLARFANASADALTISRDGGMMLGKNSAATWGSPAVNGTTLIQYQDLALGDPDLFDLFLGIRTNSQLTSFEATGNLGAVSVIAYSGGNEAQWRVTDSQTQFKLDDKSGVEGAYMLPNGPNTFTPYFFGTANITHPSGNLVEIANNTTNKVTVDYLGNVTANGLAVNNAITFGLPALTYAATTDLDMSGANYTTLALTGDVIFTTSNRSAGRSKVIFIKSDGSARGFTFPSWDWAGGSVPAGIAANKTAILSIFCIDGTDANMVATYTVEDAVVGDVSGPASSTDNALARFDLATGKVIQNSSGATLSDNMALTLAGATITASEPMLNLSQTWNAVGTTFTGLKINVTNTASASGSLLADFQVGGTSLSAISKAGVFYAPLGSVSAPGFSFIGGNTTYGMYKGSGLLGLSAGGREGLRINTDSATDPGTYASVMAGTNTVRARIGGTLTVNTTQVGNITTGEDDLMTYSVGANVLGLNADHLRIVCSGSFAANGNNKTLKAYFGATQLFTTGVVAFNAGDWTMQIEIIRISNTSQISNVTFQSSNASLTSSAAVTTSAETLSTAVIFKCTGEATATDDITQKTELVYYGKGQ